MFVQDMTGNIMHRIAITVVPLVLMERHLMKLEVNV